MGNPLKEYDNADRILQGLKEGKSYHAIAKELGIGYNTVFENAKKWMNGYNLHLQELAEEIHLLEMAKLDYIYEQVLPYALPRRDTNTGQIIPPDAKLLSVLVRVIGEKREWVGMREKATERAAARETAHEITVIEPTFTTQSDLYRVAQDNINLQWLQQADIPIEQLYAPPQLPEIDLEKEIKKRGDL